MSRFSFVCQFIPTRFVDGAWRVYPSSILTDPRRDGDWVRLFPLRISIISDKHLKAGCATNAQEFADIMAQLSEKARFDYKVGKRGEMDRGLAPQRSNRKVDEVYGAHAR